MPKRLSQEEFVNQLSVEHPNLELLSEYNGNKEYITVRCKIHDYTFRTKPNWLHARHGCQKCYNERRSKKLKKSIHDFIISSKEIHGDKYDYSQVNYINNKTKVKLICHNHGEFLVRPDKHIYRGDGCPKCTESNLERYVRLHLDKKGIKYIYQANKFNINGLGNQRVDFYIPSMNLVIECQGEQHFHIIDFFGGINGLDENIHRDINKHRVCKDNGIKIIYVIDEKYIIESYSPKFCGIYNQDNIITAEKINDVL